MRYRAALAALLLWAGSAAALEERPLTIEDSSDAARTRIVLPAAASMFPPLYDELKGRAEGTAEQFRQAAAEAMAKDAAGEAAPWRPWSLDYIFEPRYLGPVYASFLANVISHEGGDQPSLDFEAVNRDIELGQPVTLMDLFIDATAGAPALQAIASHLRAELRLQRQQRTGEPATAAENWLAAVTPTPEALETFTLEPARQDGMVAGLTFHFPPGTVAPAMEGPYQAHVPAAVFESELAGYFPTIFGGDRVQFARLSNYADPGAFVFLEAPTPGATVTSPLEVAGEVPAEWLEAGEVRVQLKDAAGNMLGVAVAAEDPEGEPSRISPGVRRVTATLEFDAAGAEAGALFIGPAREDATPVSAPVGF